MKAIVSDFDGTLYKNDKILYQDKINKFVNAGNIFIIATGRNMGSLNRDLEKFNLNVSYFVCNDGALILDQFMNIIYRNDIESSMIRPLINELKGDENVLEVLIDTINGYTNDINRAANKIIARYFDKKKALEFVSRLNSRYPNIFAYVSNNWINITKKTETKGKAIYFLADYYNLNKFPIYVIGNDINDVTMCDYDFISYGINDKVNTFIDKYDYVVNSFEEAFDQIMDDDREEDYSL